MSVLKVLDALLKMESRIAELYRWLSEIFDNEPAISGTFFRLSLQEQAHANLIAYQRRVVHRNLGMFAGREIEGGAADQVIAAVDEFRSSNPAPSLGNALHFVRAIESAAADEIRRSAIAQASFEIGGMIRVLEGDNQRNAAMLASLESTQQQQALPF